MKHIRGIPDQIIRKPKAALQLLAQVKIKLYRFCSCSSARLLLVADPLKAPNHGCDALSTFDGAPLSSALPSGCSRMQQSRSLLGGRGGDQATLG